MEKIPTVNARASVTPLTLSSPEMMRENPARMILRHGALVKTGLGKGFGLADILKVH
jgi:hypothetical protein